MNKRLKRVRSNNFHNNISASISCGDIQNLPSTASDAMQTKTIEKKLIKALGIPKHMLKGDRSFSTARVALQMVEDQQIQRVLRLNRLMAKAAK